MEKRLPKNNKEGLIYALTISIVTVTLMVLLNIGTEKEITKEDKARANYYNYYTGQNWIDVRNYDMTIDTSKTGLDKAVSILEQYIKIREKNSKENIIK